VIALAVEVAWTCGADYLPYLLERRAHIRGQLRKDLFSAHYPAPIWRGLEGSRRSCARVCQGLFKRRRLVRARAACDFEDEFERSLGLLMHEGGMSDFANGKDEGVARACYQSESLVVISPCAQPATE
jgi:hypothetical protein